ncbi:syntaxin-5 isoform X1 [Dasypus novemcinctus]|uniref:syntaxin-5 isoform X1 n=2 Tax=Dasypus novemcinctus TaxID=9361 RepID=UPI00265D71CC|nr:syntaxin-5 isoform X1 [Dasypus novemcinctus]
MGRRNRICAEVGGVYLRSPGSKRRGTALSSPGVGLRVGDVAASRLWSGFGGFGPRGGGGDGPGDCGSGGRRQKGGPPACALVARAKLEEAEEGTSWAGWKAGPFSLRAGPRIYGWPWALKFEPSPRLCVSMIPRKRYGSKNTDQGVYLGLSKTQILSPATAGSSSSDTAPLPPPVALVPPPLDTMSCRDRTQEFLSACKSLQSHQNGIQTNKPALRAVRQRSEFTVMAKRIGKDLSNTFAKLEKLTILAKRKSLFDDKAVEIEELTYIIKQDINSLNKQIAQLQDFVRAKGTQSGRHLQTHSNTIVVSLQSKLASMSNDFKSVLEVRTENLKQQRNRREQFSQAPVSALPLAPNHLGGDAVVLGAKNQASLDVAIDMMDSRTSQQLQLIDEQDSYIQSRADTMQNIESTIVELGSIFQQLAHMVKEQEETIQRIDENVLGAQLDVDAAHSEILKYFQSVTSNRWLMVKIFLILIVFFIIFVVFLA